MSYENYKYFHAAVHTGFWRVKGQKLRKSRFCITFGVKLHANLSHKYLHDTPKENEGRLGKLYRPSSLRRTTISQEYLFDMRFTQTYPVSTVYLI